MPDRQLASAKLSAGFTIVELVMTMIVIGIIAVVAAPRFANRLSFDTRGYADQVAATIRYAQKLAIAQRQRVQVAVIASDMTINYCTVASGDDSCSAATTGCAGAILNPAGGASYGFQVQNGVSLSPTSLTFRFDCLGRPMSSDTVALIGVTTVTVIGDSNIPVSVEQETGYVH